MISDQAVLFLLIAGIYAGSSLIQGLTSFGFAVISVPLVASLTSPGTAIAYNVVIATAVSAQKAFMLRDKLNIRGTLLFYLASLPFIPLGVIFISRISRDAAIASMGGYVILAAAFHLAGRGAQFKTAMRTRTAYAGSAVVTGLLSGAFSAPGPAAVPFFLSRHEDPLTGQANLSLFFSLLIFPILGLHLTIGEVLPLDMVRGLIYIPIAMIVTYFATRWSLRIRASRLRVIVATGMMLMGVYLVLSSLVELQG